MSKRKKFLIVYAIFILVALIYIVFFADSKYFIKKEKSNNTSNKEISISLEKQKEKLLDSSYEFRYEINHNGESYNCKGKKDKKEYTGTCETKDEKIEFNEENYQEKLSKLDLKYLNLEDIFKEIKNIEPEETILPKKSYYKYNVNIGKIPGEISIHSDTKKITQITIANGYLVYVIFFDNIK